jgi:hypothetical protein
VLLWLVTGEWRMANDNSLARRPGRSRICPGKSGCGKVFSRAWLCSGRITSKSEVESESSLNGRTLVHCFAQTGIHLF